MTGNIKENINYLVLLLFIFVAALIYVPVLDGPFILDDYQNLSVLDKNGSWEYWQHILNITFNNESGRLGRPVSMLSFAIQSESWPENSSAFKTVNLIIHLINGLLVYMVLNKLVRVAGLDSLKPVPVLAAGLWLIHPVNVSTILYVIQRMTLLSATFTLAAVLSYVYGRELISKGRNSSGLLCLIPGVFIFSILATFSKENGALVFLYILVLEFFLLLPAGKQLPVHWYKRIIFLMTLPVLGGFIYLLLGFENVMSNYEMREFTVTERILTETGILTDYLAKIVLLNTGDLGVFHDDVTLLDGIFTGNAAYPYITFLLALLVTGIFLRRTLPVFLFGIVWFFSGHVLESTFIPLELYFEHRNYLPMVGIIFALLSAVVIIAERISRPVLFWFFSISIGAITTIIFTITASAWSSDIAYANAAVASHPNSYRARQFMASVALRYGRPEVSVEHLRAAHENEPDNVGPLLMITQIECLNGYFNGQLAGHVRDLAASSPFEPDVHGTVNILYSQAKGNQCAALTVDYINQLINVLLDNSNYRHADKALQTFYSILADMEINRDNLNQGIRYYDMAYSAKPDMNMLLLKCGILAFYSRYDRALGCLDEAEQENEKRILTGHLFRADIDRLRKVVLEDQVIE